MLKNHCGLLIYERRAKATVRGKTRVSAVISNTTYEFISLPGKGTQFTKEIFSGKKSEGFNVLERQSSLWLC